MPTLLTLIILAIGAAAPTAPATNAQRYPDAAEVFHCDFGPQWDTNKVSNWPDRWTRLRSATYPPYLPVRITEDRSPEKNPSLRIDLDGGAAAVSSPPFKVAAMFSYVIEANVKTDRLVRDEAYLSVTFYDANKKPLETINSVRLRNSQAWTHVRIGPISPSHERAEYAVIGLHIQPTARPDVHGSAWFADLWCGRLPRMTLKTSRTDNVYVEPNRPTVTCMAAGFADENSRVTFELLDLAGRVVARQQQQLKLVNPSPAGVLDADDEEKSGAVVGTAVWSPPIPDVGFYRVRVVMPGRVGMVHERELSLAIFRPQSSPASGEFGWTLPDGENALSLSELVDLASQSGVNWLKFPVWIGGQDVNRTDRLVWLAERLHLQHIEMVGLLHQPPADVQKRLGDADHPLAAQIFSTERELWYPSLEPILTALSLKVRWWQLGLDKDLSFVGYPNTAEKISQLRKSVSRFGQQVYLGIGWSWLNELPQKQQAWDFVSLSADPPLTWQEQSDYLAATAGTRTRRWVVIEPLPRDEYSAETRAGDLARRMLAAKMQKADGIFLPALFSTDRGLMNDDGTAGDLLLPWRTTALALAGAEYVGSLNLPNNSVNHIFARGDEIVMVLWNDRSVQERVYLGDNVRQNDLWGRSIACPLDQGEHVLNVGPLPVFITGLNGPLLRWRMSVELGQTKLASAFGVPHANTLTVKNPFAQGVSGRIRLVTPDGWRTLPRDINLKLAAGETLNQSFEVTLPPDAATGRQEVRIDFDIMADRRYQFTVQRHIDVGLDDVTAQVNTRLNEQGDLEIEQRLTNETEKVVSFKCFLYIPDRLPVVTQVVEQGRGTDTKTYRLQNGNELLGKTLLFRCDEIGGQRIINYRFTAQP